MLLPAKHTAPLEIDETETSLIPLLRSLKCRDEISGRWLEGVVILHLHKTGKGLDIHAPEIFLVVDGEIVSPNDSVHFHDSALVMHYPEGAHEQAEMKTDLEVNYIDLGSEEWRERRALKSATINCSECEVFESESVRAFLVRPTNFGQHGLIEPAPAVDPKSPPRLESE